jgi:hypothetical protein
MIIRPYTFFIVAWGHPARVPSTRVLSDAGKGARVEKKNSREIFFSRHVGEKKSLER